MNISANLGFLYQDRPLLDAVASAARDGFSAVEFHWPYDVPPSDLRLALNAAGLPGLGINTRRGNWDNGDFGTELSDRFELVSETCAQPELTRNTVDATQREQRRG